MSYRLYFTSPFCPQINPGLHTIAFVFPRFFFRPTLLNIHTSDASIFCTHMGFWPAMWTSSAKKKMLCSPTAQPIPCCDFCVPHTYSNTNIYTALNTMLNTVGYIPLSWVTPLPILNGQPLDHPAFGTTAWYDQKRCSSLLSFFLRP